MYITLMAQINISVPDALKRWAELRVAEGRYSSASDLIRDLLRQDQDRYVGNAAWVQSMIDEGLASETLNEDAFDVIDGIIEGGRARREAA